MSSKMHLDRRVPVWEDGTPIIDLKYIQNKSFIENM